MFRPRTFFLPLAGIALFAGAANAQVTIRAPFVRVQTGPGGTHVRAPFVNVNTGRHIGTHVQAPFVNIHTPPRPPVYYYQSPPVVVQPATGVNQQVSPPVISTPRPSARPGGQLPPNVLPNQSFVPGSPAQPAPGQIVPGQQPNTVPNQPGRPLPPPKKIGSVQPGVVLSSSSPIIHSPGRAMTHHEFARVFKPLPGRHVVNLVHPGICRKVVCVHFTLPPGCPRVCVRGRSLAFDYGNCEVEIRFRLFGNVSVDYD